MKKITLTIIIALSLITVVSAISVGTILTQNQLDNQDVMNTDLEESFLKENGNVIHDISESGTEEIFYVTLLSPVKEYLINTSIYTIDEERFNQTSNSTYFVSVSYQPNETYWSGNYEIVEKQFEIKADITRWKKRKDEVGISQAKEELKSWLIAKKSRIEGREKRKIIELQTNTDNLDDFNLEDMVI